MRVTSRSLGPVLLAAAAVAGALAAAPALAADPRDELDGAVVDLGDCRTVSPAEAGLALAEGDLAGHRVTELPPGVDGHAYDVARGEGELDFHSRQWITEVERCGEDDYSWTGGISVDSRRSGAYTDGRAAFDAFPGADGLFFGEEVRELPDGTGFYTGDAALFVPEPGTMITIEVDPEAAPGGAEDVLSVVEGIERA